MTYACALIPTTLSHALFLIQGSLLLSQRLFGQRLGQTQIFHLISPGNNVYQLVLTDAAGVTVVMRKRAPLDTDLTAPSDTNLPPTLVMLAGR